MDIFVYIIIIIAAFLAVTLATMIGFGSKLALIAVLLFFFDMKSAVIITATFTIVSFSFRLFLFRKSFDKKLFLRMLVFLIPGIVIGLLIFKSIEAENLKLMFAVFLLLFVVYKILFQKEPKYKFTELTLGVGIFFFGLMEATIGAAGPLMAIFLLHYGKRKEEFVAFAASMFLVSSIVRVSGYAYYGLINKSILPIIAIIAFISIIGNLAGKKLLKKMPVKVFEYLVLGMFFVIGMRDIVEKLMTYVFR
jgi:uncharacterized protein